MAALLVAGGCAAIVLIAEGRYAHPTGGDPGQWITMARVYLGEAYPGYTPLQYPPGLFLLLAPLVAAVGPAAAAFAALGVIVVLLALGAYSGYALATGDRAGALAFAASVTLGYPLLDMVSWGAYPNLLSLCPFMVSLGYLGRALSPRARPRDGQFFGLALGLAALTHVLSGALLLVAAVSVAGTFLLVRRPAQPLVAAYRRASLPALAVSLPYYVPALVLGAVGARYVTAESNNAFAYAFYPLVPDVGRAFFPFEELTTLALGAALCGATMIPVALAWRGRQPGTLIAHLVPSQKANPTVLYALFVSTFAAPMATVVGMWALGAHTEYARLMYYPYLPAAAALAAVTAAAWRRWRASRPAGGTASASAVLRPGPRTATRALALAMGACVVALSTYGAVYLEGASAYYASFDEGPDLGLVEFIQGQTDPGETLALSPEAHNAAAIKWIPALAGRHVVGYTDTRNLYYPEERRTALDTLDAFTDRYAVASGSFRVSTRGVGEGANFQLRVTLLDGDDRLPVVEFSDARTFVQLDNGGRLFLADARERSAHLEGQESPQPAVVTTASFADEGILVERDGRVAPGGGATVTFRVTGPNASRVSAIVMSPLPAGSFCARDVAAPQTSWEVPNEGRCLPVRIGAEPSLETAPGSGEPDFLLPLDATGSAQLLFTAGGGPEGVPSAPVAFDGAAALDALGVDYLVVYRPGSKYLAFVSGAYAATPTFQNGDYLVLRVADGGWSGS